MAKTEQSTLWMVTTITQEYSAKNLAENSRK
jgi:hypothetical protein